MKFHILHCCSYRFLSAASAACHGGLGDSMGAAERKLPSLAEMRPGMKRGPADFTDGAQLLGASDILLRGNVLRGGMGTGMPEWGSLYSERDLWDVVSFLMSFTFDTNPSPKESAQDE